MRLECFSLAVIHRGNHDVLMADVVYLAPDENMPDCGADQRWLAIEASDDGQFFGSGGSFKANGEWVGYGSLAENDASFETTLAAAQQWAATYDVPTIWVQLKPHGS